MGFGNWSTGQRILIVPHDDRPTRQTSRRTAAVAVPRRTIAATSARIAQPRCAALIRFMSRDLSIRLTRALAIRGPAYVLGAFQAPSVEMAFRSARSMPE